MYLIEAYAARVPVSSLQSPCWQRLWRDHLKARQDGSKTCKPVRDRVNVPVLKIFTVVYAHLQVKICVTLSTSRAVRKPSMPVRGFGRRRGVTASVPPCPRAAGRPRARLTRSRPGNLALSGVCSQLQVGSPTATLQVHYHLLVDCSGPHSCSAENVVPRPIISRQPADGICVFAARSYTEGLLYSSGRHASCSRHAASRPVQNGPHRLVSLNLQPS